MRPQWEGGWASRRGWCCRWEQLQLFPKRKPPPQPPSLISPSLLLRSLLFLSSTFPSSCNPQHQPRFLSFSPPLSFLSTPPSSLRTPDTAHVQSFVCRCPFYYRVKWQKSIYGGGSPFDDCGAWLQMNMNVLVCLFYCVSACWVYLRGYLKAARFACVKAMKSLLPPTLVPICSHTHTCTHMHAHTHIHTQTLVLPICPFCAVFHPSATAVPGDTDRERNFRPHGNFVCVSVCVCVCVSVCMIHLRRSNWVAIADVFVQSNSQQNALKGGWSLMWLTARRT